MKDGFVNAAMLYATIGFHICNDCKLQKFIIMKLYGAYK